jgi:hypothetical protein
MLKRKYQFHFFLTNMGCQRNVKYIFFYSAAVIPLDYYWGLDGNIM